MAYMCRLAEEMDHLFENFGINTGWRMPSLLTRGHELFRREAGFAPGLWSPRIDVLERDGQFIVKADLPGLSKEDVKVEVEDDMLTLHGERKQCTKEEREGYSYNECNYGSFYRTVPLPAGADASKATAQFQNGVLEIVMPCVATDGKKRETHRGTRGEMTVLTPRTLGGAYPAVGLAPSGQPTASCPFLENG